MASGSKQARFCVVAWRPVLNEESFEESDDSGTDSEDRVPVASECSDTENVPEAPPRHCIGHRGWPRFRRILRSSRYHLGKGDEREDGHNQGVGIGVRAELWATYVGNIMAWSIMKQLLQENASDRPCFCKNGTVWKKNLPPIEWGLAACSSRNHPDVTKAAECPKAEESFIYFFWPQRWLTVLQHYWQMESSGWHGN